MGRKHPGTEDARRVARVTMGAPRAPGLAGGPYNLDYNQPRVPLDKSEGVVKSTRIRFGARAPMKLDGWRTLA